VPHVIATAGHVDHGKSTLITALTGIDPDRLAEEKARGLTIDLGFAWASLPSGRTVGFVDVPGHERFVHNMLAGVGGIGGTGTALLVVDAAEGWRPQSAEHLAILDLLGIRTGVVALTKADLVDEGRLAEVAEAVAARLAGTTLAGAAIVPTGAPAGIGLDQLRAALDKALDEAGEPPDRDRPRLPVDRVFSIRGAGTVVTGTLGGGVLAAEAEAELLGPGHDGGRRVRIRGLESHGETVDRVAPAVRVAANLAGVAVDEVARGDVLVRPGHWHPATVVDARLRCLASAPAPLRAKGALLLYAGAAETAVRVQLLDAAEIPPGGSGLARLHLEHPLVLDVFEPVVLRDTGRDETVGGGVVLDPAAGGRIAGTTAKAERATQLEARELAGRGGLLERVLDEQGTVHLAELPRLAAGTPVGVAEELDRLAAAGLAIRTRTTAWSAPAWAAARHAVLDAVAAHHLAEPLAQGMPAAAARAVASAAARAVVAGSIQAVEPEPESVIGGEVVDALLAEERLFADGGTVRLAGHGVQLDPRQTAAREAVERALAEAGVAAMSEKELAALDADRRLVAALERLGVLVRVGPGAWLGARELAGAIEALRAAFPGGRAFTAGEARDVLGTTRKTAIPLLEHLDRTGVTRRDGDQRRLAD
jgi:selenocysteine-specific elongation factor